MKLSQVVEALSLTVKAGQGGLETEVTGGYAADLLSCAMAGAKKGNLWITLQGHLNIVAVATLGELAGVVVTEDKPLAPEALARANEENVTLLSTPLTTYEIAGRLWDLNIR